MGGIYDIAGADINQPPSIEVHLDTTSSPAASSLAFSVVTAAGTLYPRLLSGCAPHEGQQNGLENARLGSQNAWIRLEYTGCIGLVSVVEANRKQPVF